MATLARETPGSIAGLTDCGASSRRGNAREVLPAGRYSLQFAGAPLVVNKWGLEARPCGWEIGSRSRARARSRLSRRDQQGHASVLAQYVDCRAERVDRPRVAAALYEHRGESCPALAEAPARRQTLCERSSPVTQFMRFAATRNYYHPGTQAPTARAPCMRGGVRARPSTRTRFSSGEEQGSLAPVRPRVRGWTLRTAGL